MSPEKVIVVVPITVSVYFSDDEQQAICEVDDHLASGLTLEACEEALEELRPDVTYTLDFVEAELHVFSIDYTENK